MQFLYDVPTHDLTYDDVFMNIRQGIDRAARVDASASPCRTVAGLSQEDLAHRSGLHRTYIGSVERGERNVSLSSAWALADTFEVHLTDLLAQADGDK